MANTVRGFVYLVEETKTYGQKGFRKRVVVLEQSFDQFSNFIPLEFTQDDCDSVDQLEVGAEVEVTFLLNGRKWQKDANSEVKFFLNAKATGFTFVGNPPQQGQPATQKGPPPSQPMFDEPPVNDNIPF